MKTCDYCGSPRPNPNSKRYCSHYCYCEDKKARNAALRPAKKPKPPEDDALFKPNVKHPVRPAYPSVWAYAQSFAPADYAIPTLANWSRT